MTFFKHNNIKYLNYINHRIKQTVIKHYVKIHIKYKTKCLTDRYILKKKIIFIS